MEAAIFSARFIERYIVVIYMNIVHTEKTRMYFMNTIICGRKKIFFVLNEKKVEIDLLQLCSLMCMCRNLIRESLFIVLSMLGLSSMTIFLTYIIIYLPFAIYCVGTKKIPCIKTIFFIIICSLLFGITLLIHPDYAYWYTRKHFGVFYTMFRPDHGVIWAFFAIEICENYDKIWTNLKVYAFAQGLYNIYLVFQSKINDGLWYSYNATGELAPRTYSLDFGYSTIFVVIVALICMYRKFKWRYLFVVFIGVIFTLQYGSRGAFLCLIFFIFLGMFSVAVTKLKKVMLIFWAAIGGIGLKLFGKNVLISIANYFVFNLGLKSRTLQMIIGNQISNDNGRNQIYCLVEDAIWENPVWGYGIWGDRPIVGPYFYWGYSHNIVYEFFIDFGIILGCILLILLILGLVRTYINNSDGNSRIVFIVVLAMCTRLLVSDSFWSNDFFWMLLALIITQRERIKRAAYKKTR